MKIQAAAPGRICLFGEHQDYLGFPVITGAIDRKIVISGETRVAKRVEIELPDMGVREEFDLPPERYVRSRDYLRSVVRVLARRSLLGARGVRAIVRGNIPIQAGTSSSSALVVAWIGFLLAASGPAGRAMTEDPGAVAELAFAAEVSEFGESGGRMDHYASACGGVVYMESAPSIRWEPLSTDLGDFVLGDSLEPKNTLKTLRRLNHGQSEGLRQLARAAGIKNPADLVPGVAATFAGSVDRRFREYALGAVENHWITGKARELLGGVHADSRGDLAALMNRLQEILRDMLKISTPRLDAMIEASLDAGALAAKINGSGEGGCMFAWCPGKKEAVMEAINRQGGKAMAIGIGPGLVVDAGDEE